MNCAECGRGPLTRDETGLSRKLVNRGTEQAWCLTCLARRFRVTEQQLRELARAFRDNGCTLFT